MLITKPQRLSRPRTSIRRLLAGTTALALTLGGGLVGAETTPARAATPSLISFDLPYATYGNDVLDFPTTSVAAALGYFAKEGLDPKFILTQGGGVSVTAFLADSKAPIAIAATTASITAISGGGAFQMVGRTSDGTSVDWVYSSKGPKLGLNSSLKGKKFAITSAGSATDEQLTDFLAKAKVSRSDVTTVDGGTAAAEAQLFDAGKVDVASLTDYLAYERLHNGSARLLITGAAAAPGLFSQVVVAKNSTIKSDPSLIRKFFAAIDAATAYVIAHPNDPRWATLAMARVGAPASERPAFEALVKNYIANHSMWWNYTLSEQLLAPTIVSMKVQGQIKSTPTGLVNTSWDQSS